MTYDPTTITRPVPALWNYYLITALFTLVGFPLVAFIHYCKYRSLQYRFDDKGIMMSYGILWKREIYLTYRRIQDIHVTRNFVHRWLDLASVSIQTASGSAGAEMTLEGIPEPEKLRDFLYSKMRGSRDDPPTSSTASAAPSASAHHTSFASDADAAHADEALALLLGIRDEIRALRATLHSSRDDGAST